MKQLIIGLIVSLAIGGVANAARIELFPNGVGDVTQFTNVYGFANHWAAAGSHDGNTSYIYDTRVGPVYELYQIQDSALTGAINSVTVSMESYTYYTTPGSRNFSAAKIKLSGVEYTSPYMVNLKAYGWWPNSYTWTTNPAGGAWTWSAINNMQAGVSCTREAGMPYNIVTCVSVIVEYGSGEAAPAGNAIFFGGD